METMAIFGLDHSESVPDLLKRIDAASTAELEDAVTLYDNIPDRALHVNHIKNAIRKRERRVVWALSTETRIIAYGALILSALQLYLQFYKP